MIFNDTRQEGTLAHKFCTDILISHVSSVSEQSASEESSAGSQQPTSESTTTASTAEFEKLTDRLKQRDDEISILLMKRTRHVGDAFLP